MKVSRADPARVDARAVGFRLAPRINAAGRLERADAGLELLLTTDAERAAQIADELDHLNAERRLTETRILFEAEAQVAQLGERPAYVLAGEGWHKGVIGIVASRIAERHHRPTVMIALDPAAGGAEPGDRRGTGSGRSIPGFDLLAGLDAAAAHLVRHGGHRAAAGCEIRATDVDAFRAAFEAHAAATLRPEDLVPSQRVDAIAAGDELGLALAEELERLAPFGIGNPSVSLLVPAARFSDVRTMGEGKHARFSVSAGGVRAGAVAFGVSKVDCDVPLDATFSLELNEFNGSVEPRLVLRGAQPPEPAPIVVVGEPEDYLGAVLDEVARPLDDLAPVCRPAPAAARLHEPPGPPVRDRRGGGIAGIIGGLVASGERVLVVAADAPRARTPSRTDPRRLRAVLARGAAARPRPGAARCARGAARSPAGSAAPMRRDDAPGLGTGGARLRRGGPRVAVRPASRARRDLPRPARRRRRPRDAARGAAARRPTTPRPAWLAGRLVRILAELGLVSLDAGARTVLVPDAKRTELAQSAAFRAYHQLYEDGRRWLTAQTAKAA